MENLIITKCADDLFLLFMTLFKSIVYKYVCFYGRCAKSEHISVFT